MHRRFSHAAVCASLLALAACKGGDSNAPMTVVPFQTSSNTAVFDPSTGNVPLPNILVTAASTSLT